MDQTAQDTTELSSPPEQSSADSSVKKHPVIELFGPVIQGEGSQAGQQTLFIRFGGCDYRCKMCDSMHAVLPGAVQKNASWMTPEQIVTACVQEKIATGVEWITFSGGNPLMHKLDELVTLLRGEGFHINVETQGTLWQDWLYNVDVVTVSPKSWGMGEKFEEKKYTKFLQKLNGMRPLCVKVVVFSEQDLEFAYGIYMITTQVSKQWLYEVQGSIAYYLSLGNPYPPVLDDEYVAHDNPDMTGELNGLAPLDLTKDLLQSYQRLSEEVLGDRRLKAFRFLPQLHVLVYGNEAGR